MQDLYIVWMAIAMTLLLVSGIKQRAIKKTRPTSDAVIEATCDADEKNIERETFAPETLQYLYDEYGSDHQPRTEADRHVAQLYKMLESKSLDIEGRLFLWREIWDMKIATPPGS